MTSATLHYFYDPLCGWCYGAAPLLKAARQRLPVIAHGGGMMAGARRQPVTPQLRDFVLPHDARIGQLSGQPFGQAYRDGLLRDSGAVFDSAPPTAAILAAEALAGRGLDMLAELQNAHYVAGRRIAGRDVLCEAAAALGLPEPAFAAALDQHSGAALQAHFDQTRALMARLGAHGYPSLALETGGVFRLLDLAPFLGRPQEFAAWLGAQQPASGEIRGQVCLLDTDCAVSPAHLGAWGLAC